MEWFYVALFDMEKDTIVHLTMTSHGPVDGPLPLRCAGVRRRHQQSERQQREGGGERTASIVGEESVSIQPGGSEHCLLDL